MHAQEALAFAIFLRLNRIYGR